MAESNIKLRVDARDAVNALQRTNRATTQLNQTLRTTDKRTATATANIQRFGISFRSVVGPMVALTGAVTLASRSLSTFASREADLKVLSAQLSRIGADGTNQLDTLKAAADRLGDATLFSQDDFIEAFNVLSSFRAIAVTSFTEVSEVAADIAQVMGTDVKSATVQLAKALEDPKRGLTALSRSGITFNETQTETIKKLVDSGKLLKAQDLILETIKGQYEGAATAAGTGFAGAQDLLAENTKDLTEALGKGLEPAAAAVTTKFAELAGLLSKIPTPAGQAALAIGGIALALKAVNTAIIVFKGSQLAAFIGTQIALYKTFGAQIFLTAAAQGALNKAVVLGKAALLGLPFAIVTAALTFYISEVARAKQAQADFNNLLATGTEQQLNQALATEKATLALIRQRKEKQKNAMGGKVGVLSFGETIEEGRAERRIEKILNTLKNRITNRPPTPELKNTLDPEAESNKKLRERKDLSEEMLALLQKQRALHFSEDEIAKSRLAKEIEMQRIMEAQMKPRAELNAIQAAELQHLENVARIMSEKIDKIAEENKARVDGVKNVMKAVFAEGQKIDDALEQQAEKMRNLYKSIGDSIQSGIVDSLVAAVDGTKSLADTAQGVLKDIGRTLLQFGLNTFFNSLGGGGTGGLGGLLGRIFKADGGPVDQGSPYIVGERGPELFVPGQSGQVVSNDNMRAAMGRYQRSAGLAGGVSQSSAADGTGGGAVVAAAPIDVRFKVERINNVDYVTAAEFQEGMQQAAKQGAQRGEQQAIKRLQMSSSTRRRVGL